MYPILGRYGIFLFYGYTAALYGGIIIGLLVTARIASSAPQSLLRRGWFDAFLVCFATALIAGRVGFVISEWGYFQARLPLTWRIWQGGVTYHGALLGGVLGVGIWAAVQKRPLWPILDLLTPAFALLHPFGWFACWLDGCAYGKTTVLQGVAWLDWMAASLPDNFGIFALRYQTQLLGGLSALFICLISRRWWGRLPAGTFFLWVLALLSLMRIPLALLRSDPVLLIGAWRINMILDIILVLISLLLLQYRGSFRRESLADLDEQHEGVQK